MNVNNKKPGGLAGGDYDALRSSVFLGTNFRVSR